MSLRLTVGPAGGVCPASGFRGPTGEGFLLLESLPGLVALFGAQRIGVVEVQLPVVAAVLGPANGVLPGGACPGGAFQQAQRALQGELLGDPIEGPAAGVAQWDIGEREAWDPNRLDDVFGGTEDHGGEAFGLQVTGKQTHGLVTNRSNRHQQHHIGAIVTYQLGELGGVIFGGAALAANRRRTVEARRQPTQAAGGDRFV